MVNFLEDLRSRELIQDISDESGVLELTKNDSFYLGVDPTAPYLHLGNLIPLLLVARISLLSGIKPIFLYGGATAAIGDPTGKDKERPLLSNEAIATNIESQKRKVEEIFNRLNISATYVNNLTWTKDLSIISYFRDIGKYLTVNYMLAKESMKRRLDGDGLSFTEFSYMSFQAFDFLHLYENYNCKLQIGGSDQWGNITAGLELIRKKGKGPAFALSSPLLLNSQGKKFGKSESGALWIDERGTSPFKIHQYFLNTYDRDVIKFLKMFTFLSYEEISELQQVVITNPEKRLAQKKLADEVVRLLHGDEAVISANRSADALFGAPLDTVPVTDILDIFAEVPSITIARNDLLHSELVSLFIRCEAVKSKSDFRRILSQGGIYVNNQRITNPDLIITKELLFADSLLVLRTGKKQYYLIRIDEKGI
jgi:tyrosyl-tRNA synthetase